MHGRLEGILQNVMDFERLRKKAASPHFVGHRRRCVHVSIYDDQIIVRRLMSSGILKYA